jgi:hypothetical protein
MKSAHQIVENMLGADTPEEEDDSVSGGLKRILTNRKAAHMQAAQRRTATITDRNKAYAAIMSSLSAFERAYLQCALNSTVDSRGAPLAGYCCVGNCSAELLKDTRRDCAAFLSEVGPLIRRYSTDTEAGHDFWLVRSGHRYSFRDRAYPEEAVQTFISAAARLGTISVKCLDGRVYLGVKQQRQV